MQPFQVLRPNGPNLSQNLIEIAMRPKVSCFFFALRASSGRNAFLQSPPLHSVQVPFVKYSIPAVAVQPPILMAVSVAERPKPRALKPPPDPTPSIPGSPKADSPEQPAALEGAAEEGVEREGPPEGSPEGPPEGPPEGKEATSGALDEEEEAAEEAAASTPKASSTAEQIASPSASFEEAAGNTFKSCLLRTG
jgi:hypothetical protein